ncbi:MAG: hypothetical protein DCC71_21015 [Proteobacteria bacterium]|nr:MAG: hypothetical protein DCC71_21015 [Pseudomonadota bacterium]
MSRAAVRLAALAIAGALLGAGAARAHVLFDRATLREWTAGAGAVVVAELESGPAMWSAPDASDRQEYFRVRVVETLHGAVAPGPLEFFPHAEGFPQFRAGERALLFLERTADHVEFATLAPRFPWFSTQGAGHEWTLAPGASGDAILEIARRLAAWRTTRPSDPRQALRDLVVAQLASGVPRLRRDALSELVNARSWPGFFDAATTDALAAWIDGRLLPATERLALVRVLDGAPGFDADARLRAMTREPLAGRELAQLVRSAGTRDDARLRAWLASLAQDAAPEVQREARAALSLRR